MNKRFAIFLSIGVVVIGTIIFFTFATTKQNHLELVGKILKVRSGAIDENSSAAVLDFRVQDPSDVPFVIREVTVTLENPDGTTADAMIVAKSDVQQLLTYNKFLGVQYNDGLSIHEKIAPHSTIDRMIAVRFEVSKAVLDRAKGIRLHFQDVDGTEWETEYRF